jgi:predicted enzyme related to lactoylglutathione lyase
MNRPVHFDIMADNMERAAKFYTNVFGWKIEKWDGPMKYWLIMTGEDGEPGINGGLGQRDENDKGQFRFTNTIEVKSVDEYVMKIEKNGGKVIMKKTAILGYGWHAICIDTEGNQFGIMEMDKNAK